MQPPLLRPSAWVEQSRKDVAVGSVRIAGISVGQNSRVLARTPMLSICPLAGDTVQLFAQAAAFSISPLGPFATESHENCKT